MLAVDIVKAPPKTELEAWLRWRNRIGGELRSMPGYGQKIKVTDGSESEFSIVSGKPDNDKTKDWPKHDPNPCNCFGRGHATCMVEGRHSWFNHSMDKAY